MGLSFFSSFHATSTSHYHAGVDGIEPNFFEKVAMEGGYRCAPTAMSFSPLPPLDSVWGKVIQKIWGTGGGGTH